MENKISLIGLLSLLGLLGLILFLSPVKATDIHQRDFQIQDSYAEDSTITVIAYFCKRDTLIYWIDESVWNVKAKDTILTATLSTQVMLTVTDSTPQGYNMEYTYLAFQTDTTQTSSTSKLQNRILQAMKEKTIGSTIKFRTNEYGTIIAIDNLEQIKEQCKKTYEAVSNELKKIPEIKALKESNIDIEKLISQAANTDAMVTNYLEELQLMFSHHGRECPLGETENHQEATEKQYETHTYNKIYNDPEAGEYGIFIDYYEIIPKEGIKALAQGVANSIGKKEIIEKLCKDFDKGFNQQIEGKLIRNNILNLTYIANGWPVEIIYQQSNQLMGNGKIKLKHITCDYYSVENY